MHEVFSKFWTNYSMKWMTNYLEMQNCRNCLIAPKRSTLACLGNKKEIFIVCYDWLQQLYVKYVNKRINGLSVCTSAQWHMFHSGIRNCYISNNFNLL